MAEGGHQIIEQANDLILGPRDLSSDFRLEPIKRLSLILRFVFTFPNC